MIKNIHYRFNIPMGPTQSPKLCQSNPSTYSKGLFDWYALKDYNYYLSTLSIKRLTYQIHLKFVHDTPFPWPQLIWEWKLRGASAVVAIHRFTKGSIEKEWQKDNWKSHPLYHEAWKFSSPYPSDHNLGQNLPIGVPHIKSFMLIWYLHL